MASAPTRPRGRPQALWQNQIPASLFDDAAVCTLSSMQRLLLLALIAHADRLGRGLARPSKLRVSAFDGLEVSDSQTAQMLQTTAETLHGSPFEILLYEVDRNPYYAFSRWLEWQRMEYTPKASQYPAPPDDEEPTPTPSEPDGSADLPAGNGNQAATVPTGGADQQGTSSDGDRGSSCADDQAAADDAEPTDWISWYEKLARFPNDKERLAMQELQDKGVTDDLIIAALKEARDNKANRLIPYAYTIIGDLLAYGVKTKASWEAHRKGQETAAKQKAVRSPAKTSNVILRRDKKDEGYYDHIYRKFTGDPPGDSKGVT